MPKMKTKRSAAKRFHKTGSGKFKHAAAFRRHILTKKAEARMRRLRKDGIVAKGDERRVREMLPYV